MLDTSEFIGKSIDDLIVRYKQDKKIPLLSQDNNLFLLEIRMEMSTVACRIENGTCREVYLFSDEL